MHLLVEEKIRLFCGEWIRNVSPMWENPKMDSYRLKMVKKYFQKIEFLKNEKSEIKNQ
jgi:hypothetical protein